MAKPTTIMFGAGTFWLSDGADTEVFTKLCGFTSATLTIDKDTSDVTVPDCDNPDAAAWKDRLADALAWSMKFDGLMAKEALPLIESATFSASARNVRYDFVGLGTGADTPNRRYAGGGHIRHEFSGERGQYWKISVEVTGSGALASTSVAAS